MILESSYQFISEEWTIPIKIKKKILLFHHVGCDILTIHTILKEKFSDIMTWIYNNLYNFIYQEEGVKWEFDFNDFIEVLE